ncbi:MAG TPA: hypothetical protein VJL29_05820 [Thermoguttaceae bacterium]|nr:hypothetical protein [Thermoguttaceae bacterium]
MIHADRLAVDLIGIFGPEAGQQHDPVELPNGPEIGLEPDLRIVEIVQNRVTGPPRKPGTIDNESDRNGIDPLSVDDFQQITPLCVVHPLQRAKRDSGSQSLSRKMTLFVTNRFAKRQQSAIYNVTGTKIIADKRVITIETGWLPPFSQISRLSQNQAHPARSARSP